MATNAKTSSTGDPSYGQRRIDAWADAIHEEAEKLELSLAQIMALDSIAQNALYEPKAGEDRWGRAVRMAGASDATMRALEGMELLDKMVPTERGIELAKQAYSVCSQRTWDQDFSKFCGQ